MFLEKLQFNSSITFKQSRESQGSLFKIKERKEVFENRRKPIYDDNNRPWRTVRYNKEERTIREFTIFRKNRVVEFKQLTIIVGENGCGKSTLLGTIKPPKTDMVDFYSLADYSSKEECIKSIYKEWLDTEDRKLYFRKTPINILYFDKIHKTQFTNDFRDNMQGKNMNAENASILFHMFESSNGENNLDFLNSLEGIKDMLIILDEPETSLSIKSQKHIGNILKKLSENNQVIIVTHSPYIMRISDEVMDMGVKKYVNTEKYITKQEK